MGHNVEIVIAAVCGGGGSSINDIALVEDIESPDCQQHLYSTNMVNIVYP